MKRINVLVYSGTGATIGSVRHATWSLRRLLGPNYAVLTVSDVQILSEPWTSTCALLVMPGGADLGYCQKLNGAGNRKIQEFVRLGGAYLGFCAGGYYGSARCEFEVGRRELEVIGDRELAFFPGICRGLAFPGFVYQSEAGARAVEIRSNRSVFGPTQEHVPDDFYVYYNGGGAFVDAGRFEADGIEVLASYTETLAIDVGKEKAAVVYRKIGNGAAIVTGPHPEFSGYNLNSVEPSNPKYGELVEALKADDKKRTTFLKACLTKLGLQVSKDTEEVPSLSPLHLSAVHPADVAELVHSLQDQGILSKTEDGREIIKGENDTFQIESVNVESGVQSVLQAAIHAATTSSSSSSTTAAGDKEAPMVDIDTLGSDSSAGSERRPLRVFAHETALPDLKTTPHFNHRAFYNHLEHLRTSQPDAREFGSTILYGEVVTSTSTLLEKNTTLLSELPVGLTATATTQVAGRGRGSNVWVSPPGSLMFSTVIRHPLSLATAPVVFVQYLAAMAVVLGIRRYDPGNSGYDALPIKLKWPNDVYALDPTRKPDTADGTPTENPYIKIGGILVNSSYSAGSGVYALVCGIGLNVANPGPTTGLSQLARKAGLPLFSLEQLLASILVQFEILYVRFRRTGFDTWFQDLYYASWLHSEQLVTLETEGGARARIKGITTDWGMLLAEEVDGNGRETGRRFQLQSDSNSFDFFKGLLKRKL